MHFPQGFSCSNGSSLTVGNSDRMSRGTVYQRNHVLRSALSDDLKVQVYDLRFGKTSAFLEAKVSEVTSGKLVAHATVKLVFFKIGILCSTQSGRIYT
jgi:hypothetical protein